MSATQTAGIVNRLARCEKHGIDYSQMFLRSLPEGLWIGQCEKCAEDERLDQRAREIFVRRKAEFERQVSAELAEYDEKAILDEAEADLRAYLDRCREEWRPQFIANARAALHQQVTYEVEQELLDKIKAELKVEKGA